MSRILLVDDEVNVRRLLSMILREDGHELAEASNVAEAKTALRGRQFDLVVTDQQMPDGDGLSLLAISREIDPAVPIIFITAFATLELAVTAMRQGAFDVLPKPFEPEAVRVSVKRACERTELVRENENLRGVVERQGPTGRLVGESRPMRELREMIGRVAPTNATVLITGETGTGKELVARAIHEGSPRAGRAFVAVNCAAFTENLLESELFGHERGAFTGADRTRHGVFEAAHGGTLFLDEAGEMTAPLQAKLLRVLMDGEVVRVGATVSRKVDVRTLVATHRDLQLRVREGLFRADLYYRLAVVPLVVPPLRERLEDLPLLVADLLDQVARDLKVPPRRVSAAGVKKLARYAYPGNVRELRNLLERASILARGVEIDVDDLPIDPGHALDPGPAIAPEGSCSGVSIPSRVDNLRAALDEVERTLLSRALDAAGGVQAEAARRLGISRSDMSYKIRKHHIEDPAGN